jgi:leucyl/phenylalanyl-tRNA--protein transferase
MPTDEVQPVEESFQPGLNEMLSRYHSGWYPCFLREEPKGPVGWRKYTHRGIQWLDKLHIGKKQKTYVFDKSFDVKFDTAFDETVRGCAEIEREGCETWITPHLVEMYGKLHELGHAHSFECWQDGKLVGGAFGVQMGALMTVESMFRRVDNASKAAYVRTCIHLQERGFKVVDVNNANTFFSGFGAETVPQWQFEEILREMQELSPTFLDSKPAPGLPLAVKLQLPVTRVATAIGKRLKLG